MMKITLLIFLLTFAVPLNGQITYSARPYSLQLYPRDSNDSAQVVISGRIYTQGYQKASFTSFRSNSMRDSVVVGLVYNNGSASFTRRFKIRAEKQHYRFTLYLYNGSTWTRVLLADSVCSGDVYVVNGQSNAQAKANGSGADPVNIWIRSFGTQNNSESACRADTSWGLANGSTSNSRFSIGVWAMRLARMLADTSGIPVCIINGAVSGTRIIQHLPYSNHNDLKSIYGRLLYRVKKAKVQANVKAFFWYQGESDTDTAYSKYLNRFNTLYNAWKFDYPGVNRFIVFQTRPGCIMSAASLYHQQLRENLRKLPSIYSDIQLVTTVGLPDFDGCHFYTSGYKLLAANLYRQLCDELLSMPSVPNSSPPSLVAVNHAGTNQYDLVFNQNISLPPVFNGYHIKDYFYFSNNAIVTNVTATGNTITLTVSKPVSDVTYLPGIYYTNTAVVYQGPWLVSATGIGVPSFHSVSVNEPKETPVYSPVLKRLFNIYPNPFHDILFIDLQEDSRITISNANGRIVYDAAVAKGRTEIPSGWDAGIYIVSGITIAGTIKESEKVIRE